MPNSLSPRRIAGYTLITICVLLFIFVVPLSLAYGLIFTYLTALAVLFIGVAGYAIATSLTLRELMERYVSIIIITLLPWIAVLPTQLQILSGISATAIFVTAVYLYYRKHKTQKRLIR